MTLPLLALLAIMLLFMVGQTRWAAGCLSSWISDNNEYRFSVGKISYSWQQPDQIRLEDVQLTRSNQALVAKRIDLGLSQRQITEPRYFHHVTLHDGTLNIQPQATALPLQADELQLSNMALHWRCILAMSTGSSTRKRSMPASHPGNLRPTIYLGRTTNFNLALAR